MHSASGSPLPPLPQSTKLSVYEARAMALVEDTKDLPDLLATTGRVRRAAGLGGGGVCVCVCGGGWGGGPPPHAMGPEF